MPRLPEIQRLHLADVTLPEGHPLAGQACAVDAFVIRHPKGPVLVDTGVGGDHPGIERLYRPVRRPLTHALAEIELRPADIVAVINTHLHFDHCGENQLFPDTPIFVQRREHEAAQEPLYTIRSWVDFPGAKFELIEGEAEVLPGLSIIPTPGHTTGHQSVLIESGEGRVIIAGQAAYTAQEFAGAAKADAEVSSGEWDAEEYEKSLSQLRDLAPIRVYFSHDATVWEAAAAGI